MSKEMYISSSPHETKVAVLEDDQLVEVYFERDTDVGLVGGIYKGRVSRVLPGMQSAFVDIGLDRDAFLYVSDFFYEDQEEYDKVFEEAEARATKFTTQQTAGQSTPVAAAESVAPEPLPPAVAEVSAATPPPLVRAPAELTVEGPRIDPPSSVAARPAPRETGDRPSFDPRRGRRRRHRGRPEYNAVRPGDRRFPPAAPRDEPPVESHTFEILPGESLAKYSHASSSPSPTAEGGIHDVTPLEGPSDTPSEEFQQAPVATGTVTPASEAEPGTPAPADLPRDEDTL